MMKGYLDHSEGKKAFELYQEMKQKNLKLDEVAYIFGLNSCTAIRNIEEGKIIHNTINDNAKLQNNTILCTTLFDMYSKCGDLNEAEKIFLDSKNLDTITYNAIIKGYLDHGEGKKAFELYQEMYQKNFKLDEVTYIFGLKACAAIRNIEEGKIINNRINDNAKLQNNTILHNTLIDMYSKC